MIAPYKVAAAHLAPVFLDREKTVAKVVRDRGGVASWCAAHRLSRTDPPPSRFGRHCVRRSTITNISSAWPPRRYASMAPRLPSCVPPPSGRVSLSRWASTREPRPVSAAYGMRMLSLVRTVRSSIIIASWFRPLTQKLTWANGDGARLCVVETSIGRIGMLICGENTNPLARFTLMAQGEQLHIASYPPVWPTRDPKDGATTTSPRPSVFAPAPIVSRPNASPLSLRVSWMKG